MLVKALLVLFASLTTAKAHSETGEIWSLAERVSGLSASIVYSIALTESGRTINGVRRPHPWALNVNGTPPKSHFFETRQEAERFLGNLVGQGITNVDVGLMQVNLRYHGHSVRNPIDLLDPKTNVIVASLFLRELLTESGDIGKTIANYHSRTAPLGENYKRLVFDNLVTISR